MNSGGGSNNRRTLRSGVGGVPTETDKSKNLAHTPYTHPYACLSSHPTRPKVSFPQIYRILHLPLRSDSPVVPSSASSSSGRPQTRYEDKPEMRVSRQHLRGHRLQSARHRTSCISALACRGRQPGSRDGSRSGVRFKRVGVGRSLFLLQSQTTVQAEPPLFPSVARSNERTLFLLASCPAFVQNFWEQRWLNPSRANTLSRGRVNMAGGIAVANGTPAQM